MTAPMPMKRAKESPFPSPNASPVASPPALKKFKAGPLISQGLSVLPGGDAAEGEGEGSWTKVEKRKGKKARNLDAKLDGTPPRFMYANGEIVKRKDAVGISDVRDFILHLVADMPPPSWVRVENPRSVQRVVALLIPGLTPDIVALPPLPTSATANPNLPLAIPLPQDLPTDPSVLRIPFISSTFSHACPTRAPGDQSRMHSVLNTFFQCPVSGDEKKRRLTARVEAERSQENHPVRYVLTTEQMIENDYPVPSYIAQVFEKPSGWLEVPQTPEGSSSDSSEKPKIYAIDCEMCLTEDGNELTRVCVIDYDSGEVIFDQLVKPIKPILDYLTRWSGITQAALDPITTRFEEVQAQVLSLLSVTPTPILLGHSLESDLKALKLCHPRCIDTAVAYHHPRGRPFKPGLAWLTKKWVGREIQNRGAGGHDPEEDARACVDLLRKKVAHGSGFGEFKTDMESVFERMGRARAGAVRSAVVDHGNPTAWHGAKATTTRACASDAEVLDGLLEALPTHHFAFGRFTALADALGWITPKASGDAPTDPPVPPRSPPDVRAVLAILNNQLAQLYAALPSRTALVLFTGHSDPRVMAELNSRKAAFEGALREGKTVSMEEMGMESRWTTVDARKLEEEVEKARRGLLFLAVKT